MLAHTRWPCILSFPLAGLVALASLGGILLPSTYARETESWAAQGTGQDWVDLVVFAPFLAIAATGALRGSRAFRLLLGGGLLYSAYSFVIYAFVVHFNSLFLVYCAVLGLSCFALAGIAGGALREDIRSWYGARAPVRLAGGFLVAVALMFGALWLSEVIPAIVRGAAPASIAEVGAFTNPVHVLDLALLLPAMLVAGASLLRSRPLGYVLGPMMLTFNVLMPLAIAGMVVAMHLRGLPANLALLGVFAVIIVVSTALLISLISSFRREPPTPAAM
jgi:hypothetical protein